MHFRSHVLPVSSGLLSVMTLAVATVGAAESTPYVPTIAPASAEAARGTAAIGLPPGFKAVLAAAEPELANPVAFTFDDRGRIFVCETFRAEKGVEDNRRHMNWLADDLASRSVEDRLAFIKKHAGANLDHYTREHDRLRRLVDADGDGRFETATVFADGFNDILDGIGAGVLVRDGAVYYTCIPHLWRLRDTDDDGRADERTSLHQGFGVKFAFFGHDMHGLCEGPDGRIYFSIGDRGFNVPIGADRIIVTDRGAVLRCEPDGSGLEVVHEGLRNPQELAFDDLGNLFTGDNNSDAGDQARFVQIVEGADSGWRMPFQYLSDRGPWSREKLWHPAFKGQAANVLPPLVHLPPGPSGLCYDPGVGLPAEFAGRFFLCDFRGAAPRSGVNAITVAPRGAGFTVSKIAPFVRHVLATDCQFGPDGDLYVLDYVESWTGAGKGRIHRISRTERTPAEQTQRDATRRLLTSDVAALPIADLASLLGHRDMRVRLRTQFALARRPTESIPLLETTAADGQQPLRPRLHAIWGLAQIGRGASPQAAAAAAAVMKLAATVTAPSAADRSELVAQCCRGLGDVRHAPAAPFLTDRLRDEAPRVRFFAAQALGRLGDAAAIPALVAVLRDDATTSLRDSITCDHELRHAVITALARCAGHRGIGLAPAAANRADRLEPFLADPSVDVRLGVTIALRRLRSPLLARCLDDADPAVVLEAARGIHDEPIETLAPALAEVAARYPNVGGDRGTAATDRPAPDAEPLWRRVIAANFGVGSGTQAAAVARIAARPDTPVALRKEAIACLEAWPTPGTLDRVLGSSRPLAARDKAPAAAAIRAALPALLEAAGPLRPDILRIAAAYGFTDVAPLLLQAAIDTALEPARRVEMLEALAGLGAGQLPGAIDAALADADAVVRGGGLRILARTTPARFLPLATTAIAGQSLPELKAAIDAVARLDGHEATAVVADALARLGAGTLPAAAQLEVIEAARSRKDATLDARLATIAAASGDRLAPWRAAEHGGDPARGEEIFFFKTEVSCRRCHRIGTRGSDVGPDLTGLAKSRSRESFLESIVDPNAAISPGYGSVTLVLDDGTTVTGTLRGEDADTIQLLLADGSRRTVLKSVVEDRAAGLSGMPADIRDKLTLRELRDLVAYLATLETPPQPEGH
ncbi:glucose dehydrogenase [Planctomycetia bacterium]|nr:glucose dehydrogenase [Planctomycetia bacterium]